jgi:putative nucleotidyltransferase with HDIG domain
MQRVLFVDDEPNILHGLRRIIRSMRDEWEADFAGSGQEALDILAQEPFDLIVCDMRMPGMSGADLLGEVQKLYPHIVRFALSGTTHIDTSFQASGVAHQFMAKPSKAEKLKSAIKRVGRLDEELGNKNLQRIISSMKTVPSLPMLYLELMKELDTPDKSPDAAEKIISQDIGMSAKVLQLVSTAFFGRRDHVSSPSQAVELLGLNTIKSLALSVQVFSQFDSNLIDTLSLHEIWNHSMSVGDCAKFTAETMGMESEEVDHAFIAGLLHDIGKLVLANNYPKRYHEAIELAANEDMEMFEAEYNVFGAAHTKIGAYLLGIWGLPDPIVDATAFHHTPSCQPDGVSRPVTAVHMANVLEHAVNSSQVIGVTPKVDENYLGELGLLEMIPSLKDKCAEILRKGNTDE